MSRLTAAERHELARLCDLCVLGQATPAEKLRCNELSDKEDGKLTPTADDLAHFAKHGIEDPQLRERMLKERAIVRQAATDLIAAGHWLRLYYGDGQWSGDFTLDVNRVMDGLQACDEERLFVYRQPESATCVGSILLVYGNDGHDVIADHSAVPEIDAGLKGADKLADQLEPGFEDPLPELEQLQAADKVILGPGWFALVDEDLWYGQLVEGRIDYAEASPVDFAEAFEYPELCAKARAMLTAGAQA